MTTHLFFLLPVNHKILLESKGLGCKLGEPEYSSCQFGVS